MEHHRLLAKHGWTPLASTYVNRVTTIVHENLFGKAWWCRTGADGSARVATRHFATLAETIFAPYAHQYLQLSGLEAASHGDGSRNLSELSRRSAGLPGTEGEA
jgi:hypothetical protein